MRLIVYINGVCQYEDEDIYKISLQESHKVFFDVYD